LLFNDYGICLNIGGFANVSFQKEGLRLAFDVCPANILLNRFAEKLGHSYDKDGIIASSGHINSHLLQQLNRIEYYKLSPPKSLGREWVEEVLLPLIDADNLPVNEILCTVTEHIAMQLANVLNVIPDQKVLVTGGGAFNTFLVKRVKAHSEAQLEIPDSIIVNYKEALVFALLGVLRFRGETNCLADVTGARINVSGGGIFLSPYIENK
jgi:anhydro-N-acetylmuramic acid kinase